KLLACAMVCCVLWPAPTYACEPPSPIQDRVILPLDGATNVPTNARVALRYFAVPDRPEFADVEIQPVGWKPIEVTVQRGTTCHPFRFLVCIRPTDPLAANTTFQILTRIPTVPCRQEPCTSSTYSVAATFTTGSGPDTVPPTYAGLSMARASLQI